MHRDAKVVLGIVGAIALFGAVVTVFKLGEESEAVSTVTSVGTPRGPIERLPDWRYDVRVDPVDDSADRSACIVSETIVQLEFPYEPTPLRLCVVNNDDPLVWVSFVDRGQFTYRSYRDEDVVRVRFDDKAAKTFKAFNSADGDSSRFGLDAYQTFTRELPTAERLVVEVTPYRAGVQSVVFRTAGFDAARLTAAATPPA